MTDCEVEVFEAAGGLTFPDGCGDGSLMDGFHFGDIGSLTRGSITAIAWKSI